ncbi:MAG: hypothetical protein H6667_25055 [Ardenticatenaceae bacterium]|nr:hypothetical protein [Ardenticatenaceae bacterium]MCB9445413.1 hypothetical protein [Ardenticatenaceae bacterium]
MQLLQNLQYSKLNSWIEKKIIPGRLWIIAFFSILFIILEFLEETVASSQIRFYFEVASVALFFVLLGIIWLLLEYLVIETRAKNHALNILQTKHDLSTWLALTAEWGSLIDILLEFPQSVAPIIGASLLIYNPDPARFELIAERCFEKDTPQTTKAFKIPEACTENDSITTPVTLSNLDSITLQSGEFNTYCIPFVFGNSTIARLLLHLPPANTLSPKQIDIFNHVAPDMAVALASAQKQHEQTTLLIGKATDKERLSISRDLHDTLGQNLAYLRLKLDQYARDINKIDLAEMHTELEQMRETANKSYELVRGTLSILHSEEPIPLINLLLDHSRLVVDRSKFKVRITQTGQPVKLKPALLRQIFYIFGEALSNVEKHACAQNVAVKLVWGQQNLIIKISDNGRGFNPNAVESRQHFGLTIMRERTTALGGSFDLKSTSRGTQLTFEFPLITKNWLEESLAKP